MKLNRILIRADAGGITGTGHVMRMIALAQAYLRRGGSASLASVNCPEKLVERLRSHGITHHIIKAAQPGDSDDAQLTTELAKELGVQWLVVDGYHFDYAYQKHVKSSGLSLLCTDDHGFSECWCCDAILNQNLDADLRVSCKNDLPDAKVLAGASFCLLREEFLSSQTAKRTWGRIESLLVTLGGSDSKNATEATLQLLNQSCKRPLKVRVLAGVDNPHIERLRSFESQHKIEVVQNATNMPEQYAWADGIISAGGSTCWEWLYLGLPGAIVTIADNQLPIVRALTTERRVAMPLGWFNDSKFKIRVEQLSQWLDNPQSICHQAEAQSLIDGHGADRVANELFSKNKINLEKVSNKHIELIYNWQCHPQTRRFSNNSEIPGWEEHNQWMKKKLSSKCDYFYLAVLKDSKRYCGALRLDWETTDTYVISIFLNPDFYGRGFGSDILSAVDEVHPDINIKAVVLKENAASRKLFDKVGYSKINDELYIRRKKQ